MAVPFMSRQSGFNNNNRFGNQRTMTPKPMSQMPARQANFPNNQTSLPTSIAPPSMPSAQGNAKLGLSAVSRAGSIPGPYTLPRRPYAAGTNEAFAANASYVNPAANGPTRPSRPPTGPGGVQMYGGNPGAPTSPRPTTRVPSSDRSYNENGTANRLPDSSYGKPIDGIPAWKQSFNGKPLGEAPKERYGPDDPNPGLGGTTRRAFGEAQRKLAQRQGWDGNGGDKSVEMPGGMSERAQEILRNQMSSAERTKKKYGTDSYEEAGRAQLRERSFRKSLTRRGVPAWQQKMAADNYMGRTADPRNPKNGGEPFRGASVQFARGSVQGQKPYEREDPANSKDPNRSGQRPLLKPVKPRPGQSGPRKPGGFVNHGD